MRKLLIVCLGIYLFIFAPVLLAKTKDPKPSQAFYIYDDKYALLTATQFHIFSESVALYEYSLEEGTSSTQGTQVVVAVLDQNTTINTTELFNLWGIGKNNMGLLITLYYDFTKEIPELTSVGFEAGQQMLAYFTAFSFRQLYDTFTAPFMDEISVMHLYYETIRYIYDKVYDTNFNYDIDDYIEIMYDYYQMPLSVLPKKDPMPIWVIILIILFVPAIGIGSFSVVKGIKGDGGKSVGYKFRT